MKAAVFHGAGDIRVEDVPDPKSDPDSVIVKVKVAGICGSDLHAYRLGGPAGMIFGHEISGDVVEVGANVVGIKEKDRVIGIPFTVCHQCYWCKQEEYVRCLNLHIGGYPGVPGAQAEFVSLPVFPGNLSVMKIPDSMTYETAATVEPLSVAFYAVSKAGIKPDDRVVVIGAGTIGLCTILVLKALGVSQIIVSGRRPKRLKLAKEFGAEVVVDAAKDDVVSVVKERWPEKMADIVFETAGAPSTFQQSIELVHFGGKVVLDGIFEESITWNPNMAVVKDITLIGCFGEDFPGTLDLLNSGRADTKPLITHEFSLAQAKEGYDAALKAEDAVKVLLKP